jgi:hypothetical protein
MVAGVLATYCGEISNFVRDPVPTRRTIPSDFPRSTLTYLRQIDQIDEDPSRNSDPTAFEDVGYSTTWTIDE